MILDSCQLNQFRAAAATCKGKRSAIGVWARRGAAATWTHGLLHSLSIARRGVMDELLSPLITFQRYSSPPPPGPPAPADPPYTVLPQYIIPPSVLPSLLRH
ncbi:hypothetical protein EVAR_29422_1 [Eumeta japonica]|uniref:Uncharacterized protein n=1 Tax=Eumeta variegata TaxID=151549 RepID=A0A4C1VW39_EUMVA|nr:hypothetical protein EVAR_29422_1 [Eumeta japonica]